MAPIGQTYVQLPQATHFLGLIFIVFPFRKKHALGRGFRRWAGLEGLPFASASLFRVSALKVVAVASLSQQEPWKWPLSCFYIERSTKIPASRNRLTSCYRGGKKGIPGDRNQVFHVYLVSGPV